MKGKTNIYDRHLPDGIFKDENPIGKILDKVMKKSKNKKLPKKKGK